MMKGRKVLALCAALSLATAVAALPALAAKSGTTTTTSAKAKSSTRQFTGVVTALDKTSLTVEKSGKTPRTMVFVRDAGTSLVGEVVKDTRVTVHYRQDGREAIAMRVIAKTAGKTKPAGGGSDR